jgi:hypothetical protein
MFFSCLLCDYSYLIDPGVIGYTNELLCIQMKYNNCKITLHSHVLLFWFCHLALVGPLPSLLMQELVFPSLSRTTSISVGFEVLTAVSTKMSSGL